MADPWIALVWVAALAAGLGLMIILYKGGVPRTVVRDMLHVGTGVWVLGWTAWSAWAWPLGIVVCALVGVLALPLLARGAAIFDRFRRSVSGGDEGWSGIVVYTLSYALGTAAGLLLDAFPAATALWALSLGDGIGGAVGRRLGRHHYRVPGAKAKTWEGTLAVAALSGAAAMLASWWFDVPTQVVVVVAVAAVGAISEALSPRASDNLVMPACVWLTVTLIGGGGTP